MQKGRVRIAAAFVAVLGALLVASEPARAEEGATVGVVLSPANLTLAIGETERVTLRVEGVPAATGLAAFEVVIRFDPERVKILDPNRSSTAFTAFVPLGGSPFCVWVRGGSECPDPPWLLTSTGRDALGTTRVDSAAGRVLIAYASRGDSRSPSGDGALAVVEVVALEPGPVSLEVVSAVIADASAIPQRYEWASR